MVAIASSPLTEAPPSIHPLDPLTAGEIERAWEIVRAEKAAGLGPQVRVIFVMLQEPPKEAVLRHRPGDPVDRAAFVVAIDSRAGRTYEAVVGLGRAFGLQVCAEGVETPEQHARVIELGCDFAQGYLLARPVPADQTGALIAGWQPRLPGAPMTRG